MLHYLTGNLLDSPANALVNTVNTVGVMGKGIALQFKEAFPANNNKYIESCKQGLLQPGKLLAVKDHNALLGEKLIINFPTKKHWRHPSKYEYIEDGLKALVKLIEEEKIESIAVPPLGCGNGGLDWQQVKRLIEQYLSPLDVAVYVYEPNDAIKEILQKEETKKEIKLTPARAQLLYSLYYYESLGEYSSLFSANKLAYFLQRMGEKMRLNFVAHHYGPYAQQIEHVLYALNGVYLKGFEQKQAKAFEPLLLNYEKFAEVKQYVNNQLAPEQKLRLEKLMQLIDGFQSELSLEILASVDFILSQNPAYSVEQVYTDIKNWSERKSKLITQEYVAIAYNRLMNYRNEFN
ncbi:MAG: macro domain-containing protein [Sphingobacteriales bacterium]|nr:macro domain-containing protein [Sphingobacteriales bacterium]